jgi:MOSC domain-containing protein YiiM
VNGPGRLEGIAIARAEAVALENVEEAEALAGRGLVGDRYATEDGHFSDPLRRPDAVTVIAAEAIEGLNEDGIELTHAESRRNLLTRGIDVNALVGRRFRVGGVECQGIELAEPCDYLQELTRAGVLRGLVHRGGLRAAILTSGEIAVGDEVADLGPAERRAPSAGELSGAG